jgi:hypothetical protein
MQMLPFARTPSTAFVVNLIGLLLLSLSLAPREGRSWRVEGDHDGPTAVVGR